MKYEVTHADGSIHNLSLAGDGDPRAEIEKWPKAVARTVVSIRKVETFRDPSPAEVQQVINAEATSGILECKVAELPVDGPNTAIATDGRKPNEDPGCGTGILVYRIGGVWTTSAGTPVAA